MMNNADIARSYITPNAHEKAEWARMAQDAYNTNRNFYGHRYSSYASMKNGAELPINVFDILQATYRTWLVFGWAEIERAERERATGIVEFR